MATKVRQKPVWLRKTGSSIFRIDREVVLPDRKIAMTVYYNRSHKAPVEVCLERAWTSVVYLFNKKKRIVASASGNHQTKEAAKLYASAMLSVYKEVSP